MADVTLRSLQQILGNMIAVMLAETELNSLQPGGVFLTLLEVATSSDFKQEGKLLQLLKLRDIDSVEGIDLENLATEEGVTPPRLGSESSSVKVTISDSAFDKISSVIYSGTISPVAGDMTLNVVDASSFAPSGTLYIARGSSTYESISYVSVINNVSYWTIALAGALTKNHLVGEEVIYAQGGDRVVSAGTVVRVPASSGNPAINFTLTQDVTLVDGENTVTDVIAKAQTPGLDGNVGIGTIIEFSAPPFATASVTNPVNATGGRDTETDPDLRQRIKDHLHNLAKGTERAIISTIIGVSDETQGNRVVSAFLRKPTSRNELGILFIEDGTGFRPTFAGTGIEPIVVNAAGTEQYFQLQNFPVVKAQAASIGIEPFNLSGGESLGFIVDGVSEQKTLSPTLFTTPGVVTAQQIAETINTTFSLVEARAKNGQLFVTPVADEPDYIQVAVVAENDANDAIRFSLIKNYTIRLYKNNVLLEKNGFSATIQTFPKSQWPPFASSETLQLNIDGIDSPLVTITDADFATLTSALSILTALPADWTIVLNAKFIGITAVEQDDGTVAITSNRGASTLASIAIIDGTLVGRLIPANASSSGAAPQFNLNRLTGQIKTVERLEAGDQLSVGTTLTQGFVLTPSQTTFDLSTTLGSPAQMVLVFEGQTEIKAFSQTFSALTFSIPSPNIQRIAGAIDQFINVVADDWVYLYNLPRSGLLRVYSVSPTFDYVDCFDPNPQTGSDTPNGTTKQIFFFSSTGLPQVVSLPSGVAVAGSAIVSSINSQVVGGKAELLDAGVIQITTSILDGEMALGVPAVCGTAVNLGINVGVYQSNDSDKGSIQSDDLAGLPSGKLTVNIPDLTIPYDDLNVNGTPFNTDEFNNRPVYNYLGATSEIIRVPAIKLSSNELTLREDPPLQHLEIGEDLNAVTTSGVQLSESDDMVFIIDDDPTKKTFDVPMYVNATVAGPTVPSVTQFDAMDSTGALLGVSSRWLGHRFEDYRVWFKARADLPFSLPDSQIRIQSVLFGPNGENILFGIFYPSQPQTAASASFTLDAANEQILIKVFLGSAAERSIGLTTNAPVFVSFTGPSLGLYTYSFQFVTPVDLTTVLPGDALSATDVNLSSANQGQMRIATVTNFSDATRSYQFLEESISDTVITGSTSFTLGSTPSQTLRVGDKITILSITKQATGVTSSTVSVAAGGAYNAGPSTFTANATPFTYTTYSAGLFSGVSPDPTGIITLGDDITQTVTPVSRLVTTVNTPTTGVVGGGGFTNSDGYDITLTHQALTADLAPSFAVAVNDRIQVAGQLLTVLSVYSTTEFEVDDPFSFTGNQIGTVSRLILTASRTTAGVNEDITVASAQGIRVMELDPANKASALITTVNTTAGVNALVLASNSTGSTGDGVVDVSTEELLANGELYVPLQNGESFIYATSSTSPAFTLKVPLDLTPEIGEAFKLIPMTPQNIADHFNRAQISGLSISADIHLVNKARRVQVSTQVPGGIGQVYAVGGKASGNNVLIARGSGQEISSSIGVIELDRAGLDFIAPNHIIHIAQPGRALKPYLVTPTPSTTAGIQLVAAGIGKLIFSDPLAATLSYTHTGSVVWAVRQLPRNRLRFMVLSGTATLPATLRMDDFVLVGNGSSYAGITPTQFFAASNIGYFQIRETDASTYFDVDATGTEEFVTANSAPFIFIPYYAARIGDQLVINSDSPFDIDNQGTFIITDVLSTTELQYSNPTVSNQLSSPLGVDGTTSISILDNGYSTYRTVKVMSPNPADPTNRSLAVVEPGYNISFFNEGQGSKVSFPTRLGFGNDPVPGISGYQYWTGLKKTVQSTLDGLATNIIDFEGVTAAGIGIEAREPQIQQVAISMTVTTKQGVALAALSDPIKSTVIGYINSLGLGKNVVLSEIVSLVQQTPGVATVILVNPKLELGQITINDNAIARTSNSQITLA